MSNIVVDSCVFINAFNGASVFRTECISFLEAISKRGQSLTMPAHGWFEILCSLRRIQRLDESFEGPLINSLHLYQIELIHIDSVFIYKYGNIDIPYLKAGDHIFTVLAYANKLPLITTDKAMTKVANQIGINVFSPSEYLSSIDCKDVT